MTLHIQAQAEVEGLGTVCVVKDNTDADFDAYLTREQADQVVNQHGPEAQEKASALEAENVGQDPDWRSKIEAAFKEQSDNASRTDHSSEPQGQ